MKVRLKAESRSLPGLAIPDAHGDATAGRDDFLSAQLDAAVGQVALCCVGGRGFEHLRAGGQAVDFNAKGGGGMGGPMVF